MMVATIILTETTRSLEQLITLSVPGLAEGNAHSTVWFFPDALNVQVCTGTSTGMYNNVHWHGWMKTGKAYHCINGTERVYLCARLAPL